jgi:hypothetical protein
LSVQPATANAPSQSTVFQITPTCELRAQVSAKNDDAGDRAADKQKNHMFVSGVTLLSSPACTRAHRISVNVLNQSRTAGKNLVVELVFPAGRTEKSAAFELPAATFDAKGVLQAVGSRTIIVPDVELDARTVAVKLVDPSGHDTPFILDTAYSFTLTPLCALAIKQKP